MFVSPSRLGLRFSGRLGQCNLNKVMSDAERLVGYSGSHLGLRCLLTDEVANVALAASKLIGTNHPLLKTAKHLLASGNEAIQTRGLLILLITKSCNLTICDLGDLKAHGAVDCILPDQRNITEISELIWTAFLLHNGCLDVEDMPKDMYSRLTSGNKMAILGGDFLLANASQALAKLGYAKVTDRIAGSIAHMAQSAFVTIDSSESWEQSVYLQTCSLLSSSVWSCFEVRPLPSNVSQIRQTAVNLSNNIGLLLAIRDTLTNVRVDELFLKSMNFAENEVTLRKRRDALLDECTRDLKVFAVSDSVLAIESMINAIVQ